MHPRREYSSQSRASAAAARETYLSSASAIGSTSSLGGVGAMASFGKFSSSFSIAAAPAAPTIIKDTKFLWQPNDRCMYASQSSVVEKRVPVDELVALTEENLSSFRVPDSGYGNERG